VSPELRADDGHLGVGPDRINDVTATGMYPVCDLASLGAFRGSLDEIGADRWRGLLLDDRVKAHGGTNQRRGRPGFIFFVHKRLGFAY
jgi:hypothetical protein